MLLFLIEKFIEWCQFIIIWLTGKFRHLPVVENGEVIALLDITKCLYDAISRMEKAAEQGSAIAAAVEGVERQWGSNFSGKLALLWTYNREHVMCVQYGCCTSALMNSHEEVTNLLCDIWRYKLYY